MRIIFCWDDGALQDQKLFALHEKYELPGMFFVPTSNREGREVLTPAMIRQARSPWVAFGGHTHSHVYLTQIPAEQIEPEISANQNYLQEVLGEPIAHFCLPGGKYKREMLPLLYRYFRTVRTADTMCFRNRGPLYRPALHFYPRGVKSLLGNALRNHSFPEARLVWARRREPYFTLLRELLQYEEPRNDAMVMIWGHSWEIEELQLWEELEALFALCSTRYRSCCIPYDAIDAAGGPAAL
ncbi:polysaccharide deacetylase family protein [Subdoligranulum variabile]|uniref:Polysaccharide deacetylase n=1 Tax=Subdoligranulum variabile DSM 15176 TaxID=411471 RepID=D1PQ68_9FIRM|nr:polysaccharide deacetylase family protein [Subdoligranulum variabile]EFB75178.1 polysaccharide deacetylase [Subdoligranulum variabile DSM 15176]UWP66939.1 polysaccharide deacetylase family protein [Subdoligranulum variabile]